MRMRNWLIALLTLLLAAGSMVAMGLSCSWSNLGGEPSLKPKRFRLVALYTGDNLAFINELKDGLNAAAEEQDLWVTFESFGSSDIASHLSAFSRAIDAGVDGIISNIPEMDSIGRLIDRAALEGIPVATIADDFYGSQRKVHIGIDYLSFGQGAAEAIVALMPYGARTAIITYPLERQTRESRQKANSFTESIRSYGNYYVGVENVRELNYVDAYELAHDLITGNFGYDSFFCIDETLTLAVAQCLEDMQIYNMAVVGCGESRALYEYLASGIVDAVLTENAYFVGYASVSNLTSYIVNGGLPYITEADINVVTIENLQEFYYEEADE